MRRAAAGLSSAARPSWHPGVAGGLGHTSSATPQRWHLGHSACPPASISPSLRASVPVCQVEPLGVPLLATPSRWEDGRAIPGCTGLCGGHGPTSCPVGSRFRAPEGGLQGAACRRRLPGARPAQSMGGVGGGWRASRAPTFGRDVEQQRLLGGRGRSVALGRDGRVRVAMSERPAPGQGRGGRAVSPRPPPPAPRSVGPADVPVCILAPRGGEAHS